MSSHTSTLQTQTHIRIVIRLLTSSCELWSKWLDGDTMRYDFMTISLHACNANVRKKTCWIEREREKLNVCEWNQLVEFCRRSSARSAHILFFARPNRSSVVQFTNIVIHSCSHSSNAICLLSYYHSIWNRARARTTAAIAAATSEPTPAMTTWQSERNIKTKLKYLYVRRLHRTNK